MPTWHAAIVHPKIKAGLVAIGMAALAAGARACVVVIADLDAEGGVDATVLADVDARKAPSAPPAVRQPARLSTVVVLPENPPAVDAGAPDSGVQ